RQRRALARARGARLHLRARRAHAPGVPGGAARRPLRPRGPLRQLRAAHERGDSHLRRRLRRDARHARPGRAGAGAAPGEPPARAALAARPARDARDPPARALVRPPPLPRVPGSLRLAGALFTGPRGRHAWARGGGVSVLAQVLASDDRLLLRLVGWRTPRWLRLWMVAATRLGDGWLLAAGAFVYPFADDRGRRVLGAAF